MTHTTIHCECICFTDTNARDARICVHSREKLEEISENFTGNPLSHFIQRWNHWLGMLLIRHIFDIYLFLDSYNLHMLVTYFLNDRSFACFIVEIYSFTFKGIYLSRILSCENEYLNDRFFVCFHMEIFLCVFSAYIFTIKQAKDLTFKKYNITNICKL